MNLENLFAIGEYKTDWYDGMFNGFLYWLDRERRNCVPRGPCGQDVYATSGMAGLMRKYPTFEEAYKAYEKAVLNGEF